MEKYLSYYRNKITEDLFAELWKKIPEYEEEYMVSNYGRIKSLKNNRGKVRDRILSQFEDKDGYLMVNICKNAIHFQKRIHSFVGDLFIGNPENKPIYNHKDGNKKNNLPYNLEPSTYSENTIHAYATGLMKDCNAKISREQAKDISTSKETISQLSKINGISEAGIYAIKSGRTWAKITGIVNIKKEFKRPNKDTILLIYNSKERGIDLAKKYNVTVCTISEIKTGKCHSSITGHGK